MWEIDGKSAREIGLIFGKTRNAVCGLANRSGWICKIKEKKPKIEKPRKKRHELTAEKKAILMLKRIEYNKLKMEIVNMVENKKLKNDENMMSINMFDHKDHQCHEIIGIPKNMMMCINPIYKGSYCKHHYNENVVKTSIISTIIHSTVENRI